MRYRSNDLKSMEGASKSTELFGARWIGRSKQWNTMANELHDTL